MGRSPNRTPLQAKLRKVQKSRSVHGTLCNNNLTGTDAELPYKPEGATASSDAVTGTCTV